MSDRVNVVLGYTLAGALAMLTAVVGAYGAMLTHVVWAQGERLQTLAELVTEQGARLRTLEAEESRRRGDSDRASGVTHR